MTVCHDGGRLEQINQTDKYMKRCVAWRYVKGRTKMRGMAQRCMWTAMPPSLHEGKKRSEHQTPAENRCDEEGIEEERRYEQSMCKSGQRLVLPRSRRRTLERRPCRGS